MKSTQTRRRVSLLSTLIKKPKYIINGALDYIYNNGHIGNLPTKYAFTLFDDDIEIRLAWLPTISGGATIAELSTLSYISKKLAPGTMFEFGTLEGRTTLNFAMNSPDSCQIYTLDLPVEARRAYYDKRKAEIKVWQRDEVPPFLDTVGACFKDHPDSGKIIQLYGNSTDYDFTPYYGKIDLIFIDANHEYEYVKSDTEQALKMLSENGVIIWHDYPNIMGVMDYLDELHHRGYPLIHLWNTRLALYNQNQHA